MILHTKPPESLGPEPVRVIGLGQSAREFLRAFCHDAPEPLAPLVEGRPSWIEADGRLRGVSFEDIAFIFIVIGVDATAHEIGDAVILAWRAYVHDVVTIGVFLHRDVPSDQYLMPGIVRPSDTSMLSFLTGMVDGCIDVPGRCAEPVLDGLRWLVTTLRGLAREGILIFEPHWDLYDVQEVLDLPGAQLTLVSHTVEEGLGASVAVSLALEELESASIGVETASGMLVLLWQSDKRRLSGEEFRHAGRLARAALGAGGLCLVLAANAGGKWPGKGACATLVVSHRRSYPPLEGSGDAP